MKNSIFGISFDYEVTNVNDKFNERFFEVEDAFFESKETFHHEDEDLKFDYKYCIEADYCEGSVFYSLMLVPIASSLSPDKLLSVADSSGVEIADVDAYDICSYGCGVCVGAERVDEEEVNEKYLNLIASVFETINSLRGFYLDKRVNMIGTTGWDLLDDFVNGNDFIKKALA